MKRIRQILTVAISLILLLVGSIIFQIITNKASAPHVQYQTPALAFCGNVETESSYEGKEIFNSNCAACHKLDSKSTGPALRNTDSLVFVKWMLRKNHKIDSTKIEKFGIDFHRTTFEDALNEENITSLIRYCSRIYD